MDLQIRGNDVAITDQINAIAQRHADRLDRLVSRVVDAKLELRRNSQRNGPDVTVAQVTLQTGKHTLRAEERDRDAERAVDAAMEKLEAQVRKYHERKVDHSVRKGALEAPAAETALDSTDEDSTLGVVRVKQFPMKPMDADEAIEQMELLGHDFFMFQNVDAKVISLVYRRNDGSYGLLIPESM